MTPTLAIEIIEIALSLINGPQDATVADTLLKIMQKGAEAYQTHMGEALDPELIQPESAS